jgi:hydrogenase maturation protein HypF
VSSVLGVRDEVNYEGQAAIELEQRTDPWERAAYPARIEGTRPLVVAGADLLRGVAEDVAAGVDPALITARSTTAWWTSSRVAVVRCGSRRD